MLNFTDPKMTGIVIATPLGNMLATANPDYLCYLKFLPLSLVSLLGIQQIETTLFKQLAKELKAYFAGERAVFTVPIAFNGTDFQNKVWQALAKIPYGQTESYTSLATQVGNAEARRAVGRANAVNTYHIIVPCHRIINKDNGLGGYSAGIARKEWLLRHEQTYLSRFQTQS